jgi:hypothetical protein
MQYQALWAEAKGLCFFRRPIATSASSSRGIHEVLHIKEVYFPSFRCWRDNKKERAREAGGRESDAYGEGDGRRKLGGEDSRTLLK